MADLKDLGNLINVAAKAVDVVESFVDTNKPTEAEDIQTVFTVQPDYLYEMGNCLARALDASEKMMAVVPLTETQSEIHDFIYNASCILNEILTGEFLPYALPKEVD